MGIDNDIEGFVQELARCPKELFLVGLFLCKNTMLVGATPWISGCPWNVLLIQAENSPVPIHLEVIFPSKMPLLFFSFTDHLIIMHQFMGDFHATKWWCSNQAVENTTTPASRLRDDRLFVKLETFHSTSGLGTGRQSPSWQVPCDRNAELFTYHDIRKDPQRREGLQCFIGLPKVYFMSMGQIH